MVQPARAFKPEWADIQVTVHDASLLTSDIPRIGGGSSNRVTLGTFLHYEQLHQSVTLLMPGLAGKGKTELAKYICLLLAHCYQDAESDPYFIFTTTLDALRAVQDLMQPGVPVLLDDMGGDLNDAQLIYSSTSIWKSILQINNAVQNRGRNDDIRWAPRQPKVMTTNCDDTDTWIQTMFPHAQKNHKDAVKRRLAAIDAINESIFRESSAGAGDQHFLPRQMNRQEAAAAIQNLFD